jgi:hypothetical protein
MYIPPFLAGVLATLFAEFALVMVYAVAEVFRKRK